MTLRINNNLVGAANMAAHCSAVTRKNEMRGAGRPELTPPRTGGKKGKRVPYPETCNTTFSAARSDNPHSNYLGQSFPLT